MATDDGGRVFHSSSKTLYVWLNLWLSMATRKGEPLGLPSAGAKTFTPTVHKRGEFKEPTVSSAADPLRQPLSPPAVPPRGRTTLARIAHEEFFDYQPTSTAELPDPRPLVENLTRCVIEILAGARELEQIARWVTDDVYRTLLTRSTISARARAARGARAVRPTFSVGTPRLCEPRDGVVEAVTVVTSRARARAVAIRLEGLDRRWRASAISVL